MNIRSETKEAVKTFIEKYAEEHGLPDAGKDKSKNKDHSIIFLPTDMSYKSVHRDFLLSLEQDDKLKSFKIRSLSSIMTSINSAYKIHESKNRFM